jgi:uroporphyrinogen-III synthase
MALITSQRTLPPSLALAAVGSASGRALERLGARGAIVPAGRADSEGLLELPLLREVRGKRIAVFRGEGGRELLGDTLVARGATVEYAACYARARPAADPAALIDAWARKRLAAVTVTSSEGLASLCELVGSPGRAALLATPLFVPHPRIAESARTLEFATVVTTAQGDEGLVAGLIDFFKGTTISLP